MLPTPARSAHVFFLRRPGRRRQDDADERCSSTGCAAAGHDVVTLPRSRQHAAGRSRFARFCWAIELPIARTSEMLLFMAARAQLVDEVIRPALARGQTVVSDRYLLANVVYQGHAGGLDVDDDLANRRAWPPRGVHARPGVRARHAAASRRRAHRPPAGSHGKPRGRVPGAAAAGFPGRGGPRSPSGSW